MNAPTAPKRATALKQLNQPLSRRATGLIVGGILLTLLLAGGGFWVYNRLTSGPPSPEKVRAMVHKFLRKQTGQKEFKTTLPATLTNDAAWQPVPPVTTNVTVTTTNRVNGTNRLINRIVRRLLSPGGQPSIQTQLAREFRAQINQAMDYKTMYRLIGEELWIVDQLMTQAEPRKQDLGVSLASEAGRAALSDAGSPWLAARIYEGYVWPQLERMEVTTNRTRLDIDALMDLAEDAFREAGETNNLIHNYRLLIAKSPQSPRADKMRVRLAALLDEGGHWDEALAYLKEIKSPSTRVQTRIQSLDAKIKKKKAKS